MTISRFLRFLELGSVVFYELFLFWDRDWRHWSLSVKLIWRLANVVLQWSKIVFWQKIINKEILWDGEVVYTSAGQSRDRNWGNIWRANCSKNFFEIPFFCFLLKVKGISQLFWIFFVIWPDNIIFFFEKRGLFLFWFESVVTFCQIHLRVCRVMSWK